MVRLLGKREKLYQTCGFWNLLFKKLNGKICNFGDNQVEKSKASDWEFKPVQTIRHSKIPFSTRCYGWCYLRVENNEWNSFPSPEIPFSIFIVCESACMHECENWYWNSLDGIWRKFSPLRHVQGKGSWESFWCEIRFKFCQRPSAEVFQTRVHILCYQFGHISTACLGECGGNFRAPCWIWNQLSNSHPPTYFQIIARHFWDFSLQNILKWFFFSNASEWKSFAFNVMQLFLLSPNVNDKCKKKQHG